LNTSRGVDPMNKDDTLVKWYLAMLIVFIIAVACVLIFSPLAHVPS
jgi:hypothetical protein